MRIKQTRSLLERLDRLIPFLVLIVMAIYTYAYLVETPYPGFNFSFATGIISGVDSQIAANSEIKPGDRLIQAGSIRLEDAVKNKRLQIFRNAQPGQVIPLTLERQGTIIHVNWSYLGPTPESIRMRLLNQWWIGYIFFIFGTATLLFMRPRDIRWRVMIAFNYLTALWIVIGISSVWATWGSAVLFRAIVWIAFPVYVHIHWIIPSRQPRVPIWAVFLGYGAALIMAALQWFEKVPPNSFYLGFLFAALLSMGLLVAHYIQRPEARPILGLLVVVVGFGMAPVVLASILSLGKINFYVASFALVGFPALPGIYFYAIFRRRLANMELRANRLLSLYLFLVLLITLVFLIVAIFNQDPKLRNYQDVLALALPIIITPFAILFFPRFEGWVDRHLLGLPLPRGHLLETYSARVSTSLEREQLVHLMKEEVLPSLLIRQSVLIGYDDIEKPYVIFQVGLQADFQASDACLEVIWSSTGQYHEIYPGSQEYPSIGWVRLALPLVVGGRRVGLWLLGRRDPDDFYSQAEIPVLQALANQTGIAMLNLAQAERLGLLYREDIDRQEAERVQLALELHDGVLSQLAILNLNIDERSPAFDEAYQQATTHIRGIISGLRPTMLNYGLRTALDELADETPDQLGGGQEIQVQVPPSSARYDSQVELHLYRIVQEACKNALLHAKARSIRIYGSLEVDCFDLTVADDGVGLPGGNRYNLNELLSGKHFGLAGMIERAHLIGAQIEITSEPAQGTRVRVYWKKAVE